MAQTAAKFIALKPVSHKVTGEYFPPGALFDASHLTPSQQQMLVNMGVLRAATPEEINPAPIPPAQESK